MKLSLASTKPVTLIVSLLISIAALSWLFLTFHAGSDIIIWKVRLPRLMLGLLTGLVLGGVGSCYQLMLNNPLAEPYILGISAGSAFFTSLGLVLGWQLYNPLLGFMGAMLTMSIVWSLAHLGGHFDKVKLLLGGIVAGMFFSSFLSLIMYLHQKDAGLILNILLGNPGHIFTNTEWQAFVVLFIFCLALLFLLQGKARQLNLLTLGDWTAESLGVNPTNLRRSVFVISSLLIGITVSYVGVIGFVGLIIPHLVRKVIGADQLLVFPLSALGGALFLLLCDFIGQHLAVMELPVGIITAFIGCPVYIFMLINDRP